MIDEVTDIAEKVREIFEDLESYKEKFSWTSNWTEFPKDKCKNTSQVFLEYLKKYSSIPISDLSLIANAKLIGKGYHAWAKVGDYHIDLTGDQFGREKIIITTEFPWAEAEDSAEEFKWENENHCSEFQDFLDEMTSFIFYRIHGGR